MVTVRVMAWLFTSKKTLLDRRILTLAAEPIGRPKRRLDHLGAQAIHEIVMPWPWQPADPLQLGNGTDLSPFRELIDDHRVGTGSPLP